VDVLTKLQLKPGQRLAVLGAPDDAPVTATGTLPDAEAVLAYVRMAADLDGIEPVLEAARADRLAWIAYPKAGKLGTDLNRDRLAEAVTARGAQPVRQVALDETWSALRFRPASPD
jgi:hypothetical protein